MKWLFSYLPSSKRKVLWTAAAMLFASAIIRMIDHSDSVIAFAQESEIANSETAEMEEPVEKIQANESSQVTKIARLLSEIAEREETLSEREAMVDERMATLKFAEDEIAKQIAALEKAEENLRATMAIASTAAEDDIVRLTAVYENMKSQEAAALFEEMSPEFAAGFLARMRPDAAAAILAGLEASTAYSVSVIMAGRNANAPTE